jgi:hypothetical protein
MIFADTSAWYALSVPNDPNHMPAIQWMESIAEPLITTDFVIAETLTLLRARSLNHLALSVGEAFFRGDAAAIHYLSRDEILEAWRVFRDYRDKAWSFIDATSMIFMERLAIRQAFAFDEHFRQFGTVEVVPRR